MNLEERVVKLEVKQEAMHNDVLEIKDDVKTLLAAQAFRRGFIKAVSVGVAAIGALITAKLTMAWERLFGN